MKITSSQTIRALPLNHPLEPYGELIKNIVKELSYHATSTDFSEQALVALRQTSSAKDAFIVQADRGELLLCSGSHQTTHAGFYFPYLLDILSKEKNLDASHYGLCIEPLPDGKVDVLVPLTSASYLLVSGVSAHSIFTGAPYGRILKTLYSASQEFSSIDGSLLEGMILDDLRRTYGEVPLSLYDRRFSLFRHRLQKMLVHFEPILSLEPECLGIEGWEALARDPSQEEPEHRTAPTDLFEAAELWGDRFLIELDEHFIETATATYLKACSDMRQRPSDMKSLSVNVYPESLMRSAYRRAVERVIRNKFPASRLILEISEKHPEISQGTRIALGDFRAKLQDHVKKFGISFAIDDFGVGYSSVARLARLEPLFIKIDRDALLHKFGPEIISFVRDVTNKVFLHPPKIVVEGFDEDSNFGLWELRENGANYVQGHLIGKATPQLYELNTTLEEKLNHMLRRPT